MRRSHPELEAAVAPPADGSLPVFPRLLLRLVRCGEQNSATWERSAQGSAEYQGKIISSLTISSIASANSRAVVNVFGNSALTMRGSALIRQK